ncbi:carbon catabolite repressor protein 4 homolog 4 isoform X2 [Punica granatum]|uniref:Carbon catabolite repressor protein 4 homolog 4 isoform X2 n=1 Tax=Punica granatum TaxID=22663 RepID=A0A6P8E3A2_PUNGR|nr:carbon catabolite repressor protein 4 homolog 4 isoform X2 [Punica granatum]
MQRGLTVLPRLTIVPSFTRFCMKKMSTNPSPVVPKFISVEARDIHSRSQPDGFRFRLVSYNVLAQVYVKSSLFPHSPKACLRWKARSQAILTVLNNLKADFLCLQEVDEYDGFYRANMENSGYTGIYIQRSGQKRDGCGIFYKQDRAELVLEERIEYNDLVDMIQESTDSSDNCNDEPGNGNEDVETKPDSPTKKSTEDRGDPNDPRVRLKRDCVGIMAAFRLKDSSGRLIIVANTHLYWDPEWADVKLAQAKYLLSRLARFRTSVSDKFEAVPPVIVAGDFNSTPGDKVYQYLVSGDSSSFVPKCLDELPIPLRSVYGSTRGEPPFTNCTPSFTDTLDYIFFSPSLYLKPVSFLELPSPDSPDVSGGLPNNYHPSDHLPIGTEFEIAP